MRIAWVVLGSLALLLAPGCDKKDEAGPAKVDKAQAKVAAPTAAPTASAATTAAAGDKAQGTSTPSTQGDKAVAAPSAASAAGADKAAEHCDGAKVAAADKAATTATTAAADGKAAAGEEGCIYTDKSDKPHVAKAAVGHYGAPFTLKVAQPVSDVLAKVDKTSDKLVQVSGKIASVCQKKGCWLVVTDGKMKARIKMKDYGFTVPIDSKGKETVIEGTVTVKEWTEAQVKHLEEDAGRDPSKVEGTRKEYLLTATGIDIKG